MYQRRLIKLLLLPSLSGGTMVVAMVIGVLGYNIWAYVNKNQLLYDYLFGTYGLKTYFWQSSLTATAWKNTFLGNSLAYYVLVSVAATVVGLVVYTILQGISLLFAGSRLWRKLYTLGSTRQAIVRELLVRLGLRSASLVGWALYAAFFFSTLAPFAVALNQIGIDHIHVHQSFGWLACLGSAVMLMIGIHLHIVFLRLLMLRPRLFGSDEAVEAEVQTHGLAT